MWGLSAGELLFLAVAVGGLALAVIVLAAAPRRRVNRALALFLSLLALNFAADASDGAVASDLLSYNLAFATVTTWQAAVLAYLAFVGLALDTPLVMPLRHRAGRWMLLAAGVAATVATWLLFQSASGVARTPAGAWDLGSAALFVRLSSVAIAVALLFGLVASLHAFARSRAGSVARARAGAYALAFGIQDTGLAVASLLDSAEVLRGQWYFVAYALPSLLFLPLLTSALLRHQVLDFELKMKWTLRRGTLVGVFVGAFFVVAAVVEQWLEQYGVLVGGAAVGLMLFAVRPIERAADRIADAAMPRVQDTAEYRLVRRREVYRAAVESALEDGRITDRERGVLATLAVQLGLDPREAYEEERRAAGVYETLQSSS